MPVRTVTKPNVELVKAGTWAASTGRVTITVDDLKAAAAAYLDPEVDRGPIKVGHTGGLADLGDSEPALGWVERVALGDGSAERPNTASLYGDLVGIPAGLADVMDTAYRRRSVELAWQVRTPSGKVYRCALTGLALLGVAAPAVKGLEDIAELYRTPEPERTAAGAHTLELEDGGRLELVLLAEGVDDPATVATLAAAIAGIRSAQDSGAATAATADAMVSALEAAAGVRDATIPREDGAGRHDDARDRTPHKGGPMPAVTEERIRELLKLEADADVEAALNDLKTKAEKAPDGAGTGGEGGTGTGTGTGEGEGAGTGTGTGEGEGAGDGTGTGQPAEDKELVALTAKLKAAGLSVITDGVLEELRAGATAGTTAATELATARRDGIIRTALSAGQLTPDEAKTFRAQLDKDEAGTTALLSALAKGRVPVTELGGDEGVAQLASADTEAAWDAWESRTFGLEPATAATKE